MPKSPMNVKDSSLDEEVITTRMANLTCTNWVQWSCQFENYLISKGMDDLLDPPSEDVKETNKFKKKNNRALTLLWSSVSTEFEGILLNNKSSFHDCWITLVNLLSVLQLRDHGLKLTVKSNLFIVKYENCIVDVFKHEGNLFVSKLPSISVYRMTNAESDWHPTLGHPSDSYLKSLLAEGKIKGNFTQSSSCQVCQQSKITNRPHSQELPCVDVSFFKIHMDTLQINPPTRKGYKYVLVLVDDLSRFNRIYLLSEKGQDEEQIKAYLMEINNKLDIIPSYLHTARGGEFSSQPFLDYLTSQGISLERGPPESPQTNGIAENFNQTLLSKIRCLLGQSNIPIAYWAEAASHALLLLYMLPHKILI
ncbi:hypothetical protein O181_057504 [Austropuccinia psidii MF-1]|uniref:Integrase catalytic domain-containing protein n=1 Tax=Austropuccinia psidii MF-1 TaxID=1389203 RepID=A0A9Q3EAP0_9BASI|nr:hypothetical protein [Austropuccinia psidii MF-1]